MHCMSQRTAVAVALLLTSVSIDAQDVLIREGDEWSFFRGRSEPPTEWADPAFDAVASGWESGPTGIGYGDDDDATLLGDMQGSYTSVYLRREFTLPKTGAGVLVLRVRYDDSFIATIDGVEVARRGIDIERPSFLDTATADHEITRSRVRRVSMWRSCWIFPDSPRARRTCSLHRCTTSVSIRAT